MYAVMACEYACHNRRWARFSEDKMVTFCSQILSPLHIIHSLQSLGLLPRKCLLVVIFTRTADAIEEYTARSCIAKEVDDEANEGYQQGRAQA